MKQPDTKLASEAKRFVSGALGEVLLNHSLRTFGLARAFAEKRGVAFDEEGLYVAALFHDLGFCEHYRQRGKPFQVAGSEAMQAFLTKQQCPGERTQRLIDAIDYHMQPFPRWGKGPEAGLLQLGAWADIMGLRRWNVSETARELEQTYPRDGIALTFNKCLLSSLRSPAAAIGILFPKH